MDYIEVSFKMNTLLPEKDILIARLAQIGYDGFLESDKGLMAYIPADVFNETHIRNMLIAQNLEKKLEYSFSTIKQQNWNELWESNYNPVIIRSQVYVRAPFHMPNRDLRYEIVVDPKMSFGTAHHETTSLMMEMMLDENMTGKKVLDIGCGTGILSILAEMLGARHVDAIDRDDWAYMNALENVAKNKCKSISVQLGDAGDIKDNDYDFVLANINRNILLNDMQVYATHLTNRGILLLSGFYSEDLKSIESSAFNNRLKFGRKSIKNNWIAARFMKF